MPFRAVLQFLLRKSVKSLQLVLNELEEVTNHGVTASAVSQARHKFRHTAFVELLEKAIVEVMYADGDYEKFRGRRVLAVDGSSLRLPNTEETRARFGFIEHLNGRKTDRPGQVEAKMTVLYDVLNRIPISAHLHEGRKNDLKASEIHLRDLRQGDILLADRAYGSYQFFSEITARNADFVIRLKRKTFESFHCLSTKPGRKEAIAELPVPRALREIDGIPNKLKVRFLRIPLENGEIEILATSLLDKRRFAYKEFKQLYYRRWGIETFFQILKSRLCIDNFTGRTVESIYQDFYSTIFLSGLETMLTSTAEEKLSKKATKHKQQVNRAISFHAIKHRAIPMIFDPPEDFEEQMTALFQINPTTVRPERKKKRRKKDDRAGERSSLYFQRYAKKHIY